MSFVKNHKEHSLQQKFQIFKNNKENVKCAMYFYLFYSFEIDFKEQPCISFTRTAYRIQEQI